MGIAHRGRGRGKYVVCPQCEGEGTMVARFAQVWTEGDRDADPEGFQAMLEGRYDTVCDRCEGKRVVTVESEVAFHERRAEHFERLHEQGIYPGSPDHY